LNNKLHTHPHTPINLWHTNCYLVNELLTFYLLNSNIVQDQKSLNTRHPGAFHLFPECKRQILIQGVSCMPKQQIYSMIMKYFVVWECIRKNNEINKWWHYEYYACMHTCTKTDIHTQRHTDRQTDTHRVSLPIFNACGMLYTTAEILLLTYWVEKHVKWYQFHQCSWKEDMLPTYANEQLKLNPPDSVPEAITWIEIICSRAVMHVDTWIMIAGRTLGIFNECWIFPPQTTDYSWPME
jgi:hypothetical protein